MSILITIVLISSHISLHQNLSVRLQTPTMTVDGIPDSLFILDGIKNTGARGSNQEALPAATAAGLGLVIFPSKPFPK